MGFEMPEDLSWARAKPKLTTDELIAYMRSKHVRFDLCDEVEAKRYLTEETFYAQLSPLSHLFDRMPDGSFVDLDFAYLADLVEIDRELRRVALDASLDVEARIKVELMALLTERDDEDGFSVVITTHNPDHALLLGDQAAIVTRDGKVLQGTSEEILTEEMLKEVYGIDLKLTYIEELGRKACLVPEL